MTSQVESNTTGNVIASDSEVINLSRLRIRPPTTHPIPRPRARHRPSVFVPSLRPPVRPIIGSRTNLPKGFPSIAPPTLARLAKSPPLHISPFPKGDKIKFILP